MNEFLAYHGTSRDNAKSIIDMNKIIPGEDLDNADFLGKGIYFFDDYKNAIFWNVRDFKYKENKIPTYNDYIKKYSIIEAKIDCSNKNILNLNETSDLVKFDKIVNRISEILEKSEDYRMAKNKNAAIFNFLYNKNMMDGIFIIEKMFKQSINTSRYHSLGEIQRNVICVKDDAVIKNISLFSDVDKKVFDEVRYLTFPPRNYNV